MNASPELINLRAASDAVWLPPETSARMPNGRLFAALRRAAWTGQEVERWDDPTFTLLEAIPIPALLLSDDRRLVFRNRVARTSAGATDCVRIANGRACGFAGAATESLDNLFVRSLKGQPSFALVMKNEAQRRCLVRIMMGRIDVDGSATGAAVLLLVGSPAAPALRCVALQRLFNLTYAEARVLELLLLDRRPREIARDLAVSITTVRSHLQALFSKTRTRRQSELVALASSAG